MNLLNLLVLGIIIEVALAAIFSISAMKAIDSRRAVQATPKRSPLLPDFFSATARSSPDIHQFRAGCTCYR